MEPHWSQGAGCLQALWRPHPLAEPPAGAAQVVAGGWRPQAAPLAPGSVSAARPALPQTQGACSLQAGARPLCWCLGWTPRPPRRAGGGLLHTDLHLYPPLWSPLLYGQVPWTVRAGAAGRGGWPSALALARPGEKGGLPDTPGLLCPGRGWIQPPQDLSARLTSVRVVPWVLGWSGGTPPRHSQLPSGSEDSGLHPRSHWGPWLAKQKVINAA